MQDLDPKCRHFGILWHFMAFYSILWRFGIFAKKSNRKSNPIFPILSDFFRFLDFSRLPDFPIPQLLPTHTYTTINHVQMQKKNKL